MKFRDYDQEQKSFVYLDYRKVLGEDSDAVQINDIVEYLDLSSFKSRYKEVGNPAYHPAAMMKLLIYGYCKGYFGGRPLHRRRDEDLGLMYLSDGDFPNYRTINEFRIKFKDEIADVFAQVIMLCDELDMVGFKDLSIDGQKIKANANIFQNKDLKAINKEKEKIEKQLKKLLDEEIQPDDEEEENEEEKREKKKGKLKRRKKKLEKAADILKDEKKKNKSEENEDEPRYNLTDQDSKVMQDKRGVINPFYNCQNAVDGKLGVLTAVDVTNKSTDNGQLFPMKEKSEEILGGTHDHTLADCDYADKKKFEKMDEDDSTEFYVPDEMKVKSEKNEFSKWNFEYDENKDVYICPEGKELTFARTCEDSNGQEYRLYEGSDCQNCDAHDKCRKKKKENVKTKNRTISIYPEDKYIVKMRKKLDSPEGKKIYQKRMSTVEPVHGDMQKNNGFIQFVLRGLEKVKTEYDLLGIAHNIRKIIRHRADMLKKILKKTQNVA